MNTKHTEHTEDTIALEVKQIVLEQFGLTDTNYDIDIEFNKLGMDSLDIVELTMQVSEVFSVDIVDDDMKSDTGCILSSPAMLIEYLTIQLIS